MRFAGGASGAIRESLTRAFSYLEANKVALAVGAELDLHDIIVEVIDLLGNRQEGELGVALVVSALSALRRASVQPALLVLGDLSAQGNGKALPALAEVLQVAMDNGARRALIPLGNKHAFLEVSADILEQVDPIFYGDPRTAAAKALGLT